MSKLNKKDRASLCLFTFSDGRRCRTPRLRNNPHFCFDYAQKEARVRAAETIGKDLAYFFSGDYLSACDLSTALARIIPAVVRGDIKPKTARTAAYLAQTLLQSIRLAQHEYIEAFSTNGWRKTIHNSVSQNHDYLVPPAPPSPVVAGLQTGAVQAPQPAPPPTASTTAASNVGAGLQPGPHAQPARPNLEPPSTPPQPAAPSMNCHSERSEESTVSPTSAASPTPPPASQSPAPTTGVIPPIPAAQPACAPRSNPPQPTPVGHLGIHPNPVGRSQALPLPVRRRFHRTD